jgi:CRISPR-associated protein Csm3
MLLKKLVKIEGTIRLRTGLHIGAGKDAVEIGGVDQPIVKDPLSGAPFIPGSSLKGKMRSLLELKVFQQVQGSKTWKWIQEGKPCGCGKPDCYACVIFGCSDPKNRSKDLGPTRLIVRDAFLTPEDQERFQEGELNTEIKFENTINRVTGVARHPRPLERVPAGVGFTFEMVLRVFEGDDEETLLNYVKQGLRLVELDYLGGNGSRGCGQVEFEGVKIDGSGVDLKKVEPEATLPPNQPA